MDLNSDLGEGFGVWRLGDDDALLAVVTSANVACGGHAGDPSTMDRVCRLAARQGVAVGAQVGYRDLAGFGRRHIAYDLTELRDEIRYQIGALAAFGPVRYVKPHGALYHAAATDPGQADAVVTAIHAWRDRWAGQPHSGHSPDGQVQNGQAQDGPGLPVLCQPGSELARRAAEAGLRVVGEGFPDRAYLPDGRLAPRGRPGAVLTDPGEVAERAVRMATERTVLAVDGTVVDCPVESLCVHGDTPGAAALAERIRAQLTTAGVPVEPFTRSAG